MSSVTIRGFYATATRYPDGVANDDTDRDLDQLDQHRAEWERERDDADESWMTFTVPGPDDEAEPDFQLPDSVINPTLRDQQQRALYTMELYIAEARSAIFRGEPFAPPTGYYWETNVIDPLCWSDG
jgi:hypothetical protein